MSITIDGNQGISYPDGTLMPSAPVSPTSPYRVLTNRMPAGAVLQALSTTTTALFSASGSSYVDVTGLSVTITPQSTTSKILVLLNISGGASGSNAQFKISCG